MIYHFTWKMASVTAVLSATLFGADSVKLSCKTTAKNNSNSEFTKSLSALDERDVEVTLWKDSAELVFSKLGNDKPEVKFSGTTHSKSLSGNFLISKDEGKYLSLELPNASSLLGAKTSTLRLVAGVSSKNNRQYFVTLACKNQNPGIVASFVKICDQKPTLKNEFIDCEAFDPDETYAMPTKFSIEVRENDYSVSYEHDKHTKTDLMKFVPSKPAKNSAVKYLEYCFISNPKSKIAPIWISPELITNGYGKAIIPEASSDGGSYVGYKCSPQKE